ncbi:hypothetical protein [Sagittula salina]|uniref:Uncharacterized protein n=1 Tax=Sagittula salina TaxID=2820268 RepID=A0A940MH09_9RHOB|nr:hypothetical protein [Sagittula salina]MBP0481361.1 hypothetical protein [Sagittula salina]
MAGHFLLPSLPYTELYAAQTLAAARWSGRAHAAVGWNQASEAVLTAAINGGNIGNRNGLPPHRYLQFDAEPNLSEDATRYFNFASWVDALTRPASIGLGLRALCPAAQQSWPHDKSRALREQIAHGDVSVEVYYLSGIKI